MRLIQNKVSTGHIVTKLGWFSTLTFVGYVTGSEAEIQNSVWPISIPTLEYGGRPSSISFSSFKMML